MPKRDRTIFEPDPRSGRCGTSSRSSAASAPRPRSSWPRGFFPPGPTPFRAGRPATASPGLGPRRCSRLAQDAGLIETPMDALVRDFKLEAKR